MYLEVKTMDASVVQEIKDFFAMITEIFNAFISIFTNLFGGAEKDDSTAKAE